jgi:hypothetical protein
VEVYLAAADLVGEELVDHAAFVDLAALQGVIVEAAKPLEVGGVLAELGSAIAGSKTTVVHGVVDLRRAL